MLIPREVTISRNKKKRQSVFNLKLDRGIECDFFLMDVLGSIREIRIKIFVLVSIFHQNEGKAK
jgi:hypothetical protein